jgi:hypothetical protein
MMGFAEGSSRCNMEPIDMKGNVIGAYLTAKLRLFVHEGSVFKSNIEYEEEH